MYLAALVLEHHLRYYNTYYICGTIILIIFAVLQYLLADHYICFSFPTTLAIKYLLFLSYSFSFYLSCLPPPFIFSIHFFLSFSAFHYFILLIPFLSFIFFNLSILSSLFFFLSFFSFFLYLYLFIMCIFILFLLIFLVCQASPPHFFLTFICFSFFFSLFSLSFFLPLFIYFFRSLFLSCSNSFLNYFFLNFIFPS